jgi:hypothetical protein
MWMKTAMAIRTMSAASFLPYFNVPILSIVTVILEKYIITLHYQQFYTLLEQLHQLRVSTIFLQSYSD